MQTGIIKYVFCLLLAVVLADFSNGVLAADTASPNDKEQAAEELFALEKRVSALEENRWLNKIAIHGVLAGAYQHEDPGGPADAESSGRGAVVFQPEIAFTPTPYDEIFVKFGFAGGNGLNEITPMAVVPWAADLEADVKDINGRDRDYLLAAWYKHTFALGQDHDLGVTGGIIDATDYLDQNAYANDEYTQFMNPALVNGPNGFAPSYDIGGAVQWNMGPVYANGVIMNIGENNAGINTNVYGAELGYTIESVMGAGTYRLIYEGAQDAFPNPAGTTVEDRMIVFVSCDQQFGEHVAGWVRFGWGSDDAAVDFTDLYSGGIDIGGGLWDRGQDNVGLGYALADGGNTGLDRVQVAEAYYRLVMNDWVALTGDVQYQDNRYDDADSDIDAWTWGMRAVVEF